MNKNWKITGFVATVIIVLAFPLYIIKALYFDGFADKKVAISTPQFVGSETCIECHKTAYDLWLQSDHYFAMDTASPESIFGDFNNVEIERNGQIHKFYQRDGKFYAFTDGPEGKMEEFEIKYTFGAWPLQQYLVDFPDGKLQTLGMTWDTIQKQWYSMADAVYLDQDIDHTNWLHWTKLGQNWNGMCADCHSTNLKKGFDSKTNTFNTTWSEINVGCEACHGPSSEHLKWANLPAMARPADKNFALVVKTSGINNKQYVNQCARCHTRRSALADYNYEWTDLLDQMIPQLPVEPNYYIDGQILEEDYVFGSFTQSKMYMNDVQCNDCHNVHSGKLILDGNQLCLQCHRQDTYDSYNHHFHKEPGESGKPVTSQFGDTYQVGDGASCINCHMPGRYYMGVDYRRDHSFRIPSPEMTEEFSTPNACNYCHADQSTQWASSYMDKWYGESRKLHYGSIIAQIDEFDTIGVEKLTKIIKDELFPPILRASAMLKLSELYPFESNPVLLADFSNIESIIRFTAVRNYQIITNSDVSYVASVLNDPVKAIRMEAASKLAALPSEQIPAESKKVFEQVRREYISAMKYSADFAASRLNLGNSYNFLGDTMEAIKQFKEAIKIDDEFFPAKINLAMLYNQLGDNEKAELLLKDVVKKHPDQTSAKYSLGLLLAEMTKYEEAVEYLSIVTLEMPTNLRAFYNLGQLQDFLGNVSEAEDALRSAYQLDPSGQDLQIALIQFYLKHQEYKKAKPLALKYKQTFPDDPSIKQVLDLIEKSLN